MFVRTRMSSGSPTAMVREPRPAARAVRGEGTRRPLAVPLLLQLDTTIVSKVILL